ALEIALFGFESHDLDILYAGESLLKGIQGCAPKETVGLKLLEGLQPPFDLDRFPFALHRHRVALLDRTPFGLQILEAAFFVYDIKFKGAATKYNQHYQQHPRQQRSFDWILAPQFLSRLRFS